MFLFKFPFGPIETNAILIACPRSKKAAAIDPSAGSAGAILDKASQLGLTIEKILLTHSHWDHFADANLLQTATKAPLYVHPLDRANVEHPGADRLPLFIPIAAARVDHLLNEGEVIEVGDLKLEVLHTPGHSPGSVCFYLQQQNVLIAGDTLFKGTYGRVDLPTGQPELMKKSLNRLGQLPKETRVIPGHGDETSINKESWIILE